MMNKTAIHAVQKRLGESGLDSLIVSKLTDIRYLTGFAGDYGFLAIGSGKPFFFTSSLYAEEARQLPGNEIEIVEVKKRIFPEMHALGKDFWGKRIGYDPLVLTCHEYTKMVEAFTDSTFAHENDILKSLRSVKTEDEIVKIDTAQRIAETVLESIIAELREGVTEIEIAAEIEYRFKKKGGEKASFDTIAAFGENSSKPHARPGSRKLKHGDIVLFDMGTVVEGYASDMTRSYVFGKADEQTKSIYAAVLGAQEHAIKGIKKGISGSEADSLARTFIDEHGYGEHFIHSLGHGVGLDIHEHPTLSKSSDTVLETGMVVTVEPGVYLEGQGGIRIEDMVVVDGDGIRNLTRMPKELIEL